MSYNVYPVQKVDYACSNYKVFIDGKEVKLNSARVSSYPMNRRWPGHQRTIDQTEIINFLSLSVDNPVKIKIIPEKKSQSVEIRPKSLNITPTINTDGSIEFTMSEPAKLSVEPYGLDNPLIIFADEHKDYKIDKADKNVLYFGAGVHDLGYYQMKSNQTIFIDEGAVVYATINALNVKNIKILGHGILDNSKNREIIKYEASVDNSLVDINNAKRIYPIEIDCCENVEIDGITLRDPLAYNINLVSCKNIMINNFKTIGDWRYNSDGVHFANCINGTLKNSFLRTFDDCVCVRGYEGSELERILEIPDILHECKNIRVYNNILWNDWDVCFRIGAATLSDEIHDVIIENNDVIHLTGAVFDCINCDYGNVFDFVYRNTNIEYDEKKKYQQYQMTDTEKYCDGYEEVTAPQCLIYFALINHFEYTNKKFNPDNKLGQLHDITFENIYISGKYPLFAKFEGINQNAVCRNIKISKVYKNGKPLKKEELPIQCNDFVENVEYFE